MLTNKNKQTNENEMAMEVSMKQSKKPQHALPGEAIFCIQCEIFPKPTAYTTCRLNVLIISHLYLPVFTQLSP